MFSFGTRIISRPKFFVPSILVALSVALLANLISVVMAYGKDRKIGVHEHASIHARHKMMENAAFSIKAGSGIVRRRVPYDDAKAEAIMRLMRTTADNMLEHFGLESQPGPDSKSMASSRIWSDWRGFKKQVQQFRNVAAAAEQGASDGPAAFAAGLISVQKECKSCHEIYKLRK